MKWGRKKTRLASSPRRSLVSSWLFKFKKIGCSSSEAKPDNVKLTSKLNSHVPMGLQQHAGDEGGRFYGEDDDAFWRISFGEEGADRQSCGTSTVQTALYDSDDELDVPEPCCQSCRSNSIRIKGREKTRKFSGMVTEARKMGGMSNEARVLPKLSTCRGNEDNHETPRREARKDGKLRLINRKLEGELEAAKKTHERMTEKDNLVLGPEKTIRTAVSHSRMHCDESSKKSGDSYPQTTEEDTSCLNMDKRPGVNADVSPDWQRLKEMKIEEFKSKAEKQRRSVYMSRELQRNKPKQASKVRVFSPRTASKVEICKIKAIEDMKKANKLKMKRTVKDRIVSGQSTLENFAVVKCSYDPQKDFRDSMIEMITEKNLSMPEELEELLSCYLTLNSDEYHDLIIKVFKEVWFQLSHERFRTKIQNEYCY